MSFDQRPNKIRVVADGPKAQRGDDSAPGKAADSEGTPLLGQIGSRKRSGDAKAAKAAKAAKKAKAGSGGKTAGGAVAGATGTSAASGPWMIAALLFLLGCGAGGAVAMATLFR